MSPINRASLHRPYVPHSASPLGHENPIVYFSSDQNVAFLQFIMKYFGRNDLMALRMNLLRCPLACTPDSTGAELFQFQDSFVVWLSRSFSGIVIIVSHSLNFLKLMPE